MDDKLSPDAPRTIIVADDAVCGELFPICLPIYGDLDNQAVMKTGSEGVKIKFEARRKR